MFCIDSCSSKALNCAFICLLSALFVCAEADVVLQDIQEDATGSLRASSPYLGRVNHEPEALCI